MQSISQKLLFLTILVVMMARYASASPYSLNYSGKVTDPKGKPLKGPVKIKLEFYRSIDGNDKVEDLGIPEFVNIELNQGVFSLNLDLTPEKYNQIFSSTLDGDGNWVDTYLQIVVTAETGAVITYPRQKFNATPYAFKVPVDFQSINYNSKGELQVSDINASQISAGEFSTDRIPVLPDSKIQSLSSSKLSGTIDSSLLGSEISKIGSTIDTSEIEDGTILFQDFATNGCSSGQILKYDGSSWTCGNSFEFTDNDNNPILTGDGFLHPAKIQSSTITNAKVASGISASKIGDGSVSNSEFQALDGVTGSLVAFDANSDLEVDGGIKLRDNDLSSNFRTTLRASGELTENNTYTLPAAPDDGRFLTTDTNGVLSWALPTTGAPGADTVDASMLRTDSVTEVKIATDAVTTSKIAANAVIATKIASDAVVEAKIADGAVTTDKIADDAITAAKLAPGAVDASDFADGSIATAKLANSAVDDTKLATNAVTNAKIADNAVDTAEIAALAVTDAKLAADAVTNAKIADNAVNTAEIAALAVTDAKLASDAVTTAKVASSAITDAKLATDAVTNAKIADNAVDTAEIATDAITNVKIADNAVDTAEIAAAAITANELDANAVTTAKILNDAVTATKLADNAVVSTKIQNNAVTTDKIADDAITADKIAAGAIAPTDFSDGSIPTAKIANSAITDAKLATDAVTSAKIADNAVDTAEIATAAVTASELDANAVTTAKILNDAVTTAKIATNAITANEIDANAIVTAKVLNSAITTAKIADDAITADKIAAGAISPADFSDGSIPTAKIANSAITDAKLATDAVTNAKIADNAVDTAEIVDDAINADKIADSAISNAHIAAGANIALSKITGYGTIATQNSNAVSITGGSITGVSLGNLTSTGIDDNSASTAITINSSNRVGVGTTSPDAPFHAEDNATTQDKPVSILSSANGSASYRLAAMKGDESPSAHAYTGGIMTKLGTIFSSDTNYINAGINFHRGDNNINGFLSFFVNNNTRVMTLNRNGMLGIGDELPSSLLTVTGDSQPMIAAKGGATGDNKWLSLQDQSDNELFGVGRQDNGARITTWSGGTSHLILDPNDNVGIGETSPETKLHIKENINFGTAQILLHNNGNGDSRGRLYIGSFADSAGFHITSNAVPAHTNNPSDSVSGAMGSRTSFELLNINSTTDSGSYFDVRTRALGESTFSAHTRFRGDGKVSIGSTAPIGTLHVGPSFSNTEASITIQEGDSNSDAYTFIDDSSETQLRIVKFNSTNSANGGIIDISPMSRNGTSSSYVRLFRETNTTGDVHLSLNRGNNSAYADTLFGVNGMNSYINGYNLTGGNLGIGNYSPSERLDVTGNIKASGHIQVESYDDSATGDAGDTGLAGHYVQNSECDAASERGKIKLMQHSQTSNHDSLCVCGEFGADTYKWLCISP